MKNIICIKHYIVISVKMVMLPIDHCATVVLNARFNDIVKRDQLLTSKTVILGGDTSIFRIFAHFYYLYSIYYCCLLEWYCNFLNNISVYRRLIWSIYSVYTILHSTFIIIIIQSEDVVYMNK